MKYAALVALFSALLPYVTAHGYFGELKIDGKSYTGNAPGNANSTSFCVILLAETVVQRP